MQSHIAHQVNLAPFRMMYLIIVSVVEILIIIVLVLLHLIAHRPLPRGCVPIVHRVIGITSGTNIRPRCETRGTAEHNTLQQLFSNWGKLIKPNYHMYL